LQGGEIPHRDFRLTRGVDGALCDEHVRPEVAERPRPPDSFGQRDQGVAVPAGERRIRQERVVDRGDAGDVETTRTGRAGCPRAVAASGPPSAIQSGRGHDAEDDHVVDPQCDQRRPDGDAANVVLRPVDRVDDPRALAGAGRTGFLADDRVVRPFGGEGSPYGVFDRAIRVGDGGQVGLGLDEQVGGEEAREAQRVRRVGEGMREREIARPLAAHGGQPYWRTAPGVTNRTAGSPRSD